MKKYSEYPVSRKSFSPTLASLLCFLTLCISSSLYAQENLAELPTESWPTNGGATLINSHDSGAIVDIIIRGGEQMPPLASAFTSEQLRDVAAYVTETLAE